MQKIQYCTLVLLIGSLCAMGFWSGTVQDQIISYDDNMLGWYSRMAVDSEGKIHVVWKERTTSTHYEMHYTSSADNGRTWSAMAGDIVISYDDGISPNNESSIAVDSYDNIYVVWSEEHSGIDEIHYSISTDGGSSWSGENADLILSYIGGSNALYPEIAIDQNDVIHVVWIQNWESGANEVYYSRSIDGGVTWSSQTEENVIVSYPDGQHAIYPDIAIGLNNEILVVWREDDDVATPYDVINFSVSTDGGNTWSGNTADYRVTQPFTIASYPHNAVDPDGNFHVVWWGTHDTSSPYHYEMYYSRSLDGGASWSGELADQMISYYQAGGASVSNPNFGVDHCGYLYAVWNEDYMGETDEIHISVSTDTGMIWSGSTQDEIISFPDGINAYRPYIVAGIDDTLHVCWNEGIINNYYQIHYSRGDAICEGGVEPPTVSDIPDQTINEGESFQTITLDNYVTDPVFQPEDMEWTTSGAEDLEVTIEDRVATIAIPHEDWFGEETITFRATNPHNLSDSDPATFAVLSVNDPPVIDPELPDITFPNDSSATIDLDSYGSDVEDPDSLLTWSFSGNTSVNILIDENHIATFTAEAGFVGEEEIVFILEDTELDTDMDTILVTVESSSWVPGEEQNGIPNEYFLAQNYPNPFNPTTYIRFGLPEPSNVKISVYNILGQIVATPIEGLLQAGYHGIIFKTTGLSGGLYFYSITTPEFKATRKMVLLR